MEPEKKIKLKNMFYAIIKGGLEHYLKLVIDKIHKLHGNDWAAFNFEKSC